MSPKEYPNEFRSIKSNKGKKMSKGRSNLDNEEIAQKSLQSKIAERKALDEKHLAELHIDQIKRGSRISNW